MSAESYWDHIEEAFDEVNIYDGGDIFLANLRKYPDWIGDLLSTHWIPSEIANGGLTQFFLNSTGVLAPEAAAGFDRIGLPAVSATVREAMGVFGATYPREREARSELLAAKSGHQPADESWNAHELECFEVFEKKLYELGGEDFGKIYDRMDDYAKTNAV